MSWALLLPSSYSLVTVSLTVPRRSEANQEPIMTDPTEEIRRERLAEINAEPGDREALEARYGQV